LLIVVLFDFLNFKSVKIYAIQYICSTTLLLYKLDTLLLKQMNFPVLDIPGNGFLFSHEYSGVGRGALGLHLSTHAKKETRYEYPIRAASFVSIVLYPIHIVGPKRRCGRVGVRVMVFNATINNISVTFVYRDGQFYYWWRKPVYQKNVFWSKQYYGHAYDLA
jgi:hypothetical protein